MVGYELYYNVLDTPTEASSTIADERIFEEVGTIERLEQLEELNISEWKQLTSLGGIEAL